MILSYFSYSKLNYSTNFRLYLKLFYFKLIYVISSYTLIYYKLFYPKYNNFK
jgi:hypothetical protein